MGTRKTDSWDVFISHASEDKNSFVRPLANALLNLGVSVWYDEFSLRVGDSLSRSIDNGLSASRYAIVVISPDFLDKKWPEFELRGLVGRDVHEGDVILPLWHGVTRSDVADFSLTLADTVALNTSMITFEEVAVQLLHKIRPELYAQSSEQELQRRVSIAKGRANARLPNVSGDWVSRAGELTLSQTGDRVTGEFDWHSWRGSISGQLVGERLVYEWVSLDHNMEGFGYWDSLGDALQGWYWNKEEVESTLTLDVLRKDPFKLESRAKNDSNAWILTRKKAPRHDSAAWEEKASQFGYLMAFRAANSCVRLAACLVCVGLPDRRLKSKHYNAVSGQGSDSITKY